MFTRYTTREACWGAALWAWLMGGIMALAYLGLGNKPQEEWVPYAAITAFVLSAILFFLAHRNEFMLSVRESMCGWGSGKADLTQFCYFIVLPFYMVFHIIALVSSAREQLKLEAEGHQANAEIEAVFNSITPTQPSPKAPLPMEHASQPCPCPTCQRPVPAGRHCSYCGVAKIECPECHMKCPPNMVKCQYCGAKFLQ
ncbi:zinc ribbon domain-containing protein [bacterium]|nr:zinc ribbon domain-containing protein [bacterium]